MSRQSWHATKQSTPAHDFLPWTYSGNWWPGTFEHALDWLVDHELDLTRSPLAHTQRMKERIDSNEGRRLYGQRFATVEPVFGNIWHNKRLNRFTLREYKKVDGQWKLFCMVHNIEKLANYGFAMPPTVGETTSRRNLNA